MGFSGSDSTRGRFEGDPKVIKRGMLCGRLDMGSWVLWASRASFSEGSRTWTRGKQMDNDVGFARFPQRSSMNEQILM